MLLLLVVNFSPIRMWLTHTLAHGLAERLGTEVSIGEVQIGLFNRVVITDVQILDGSKHTLLKAKRATAKIELRSLFRSQLALRTVSLLDADINLYKESPSKPDNFQFIIDAFASKEKKTSAGINLRINSLILRRVHLAYDRYYISPTPGILNASHLSISNLNANISLKSITPDELRLRVRSFSFTEQSGFSVNSLSFKLNANRRGADIQDFELHLPHSYFEQSHLTALYNASQGWKNLLPTLRLHGEVENIQLSTDDVRHLVRLPENISATARMSTSFIVTPERVQFNNLRIGINNDALTLCSNVALQRQEGTIQSVSANSLSLHAKSSFIAENLPVFLPDSNIVSKVCRLGDVEAKGDVLYRFSGNSLSNIRLFTEAGTLAANAEWDKQHLSGTLKLQNVQPAKIMNNGQLPENISLHADIDASLLDKKLASATTHTSISALTWNDHHFQPINVDASWHDNHLTYQVQSHDALADFALNGSIHLRDKKPNALTLNAHIQSLCPKLLNASSPLLQATYSGDIQLDVKSTNPSNPQGTLNIKNFNLTGGPHGDYTLHSLQLSMQPCTEGTDVQLASDFADVRLQSPLVLADIKNGIQTLAARALPGLLPEPTGNVAPVCNIDVWLKNTDFLRAFTGTKLSLASPLHLHGTLHTGDGRTSLTASTDGVAIGGQEFREVSLFLHGQGSKYQALLKTIKNISGSPYRIEADIATSDSLLISALSWKGQTTRRREGKLEAETRFATTTHKGVDFATHIRPTQFFLADSVWNIASGTIAHQGREFSFHNVSVSHDNQSLTIDGRLSPERKDSIVANLCDIDIAYILGLINFDAVQFGGLATGTAVFTNAEGGPRVHGLLHLPDFRFNDGPMGNTDIAIGFSTADKRITLDADMHLPSQDAGTQVKGYVSLAEKGLDLQINARQTNLQFLRRYMDGIFGNFDGTATGYVHLYGPFKQLDFQGNLTANAQARILSTGVDYKVSNGKVELIPGAFRFNDFTVSDESGGSGIAYGELCHTHLKNLRYDFSVSAQHILCYDKEQEPDLPFYSTTTGSGSVHLQGRPQYFQADINLRPESPTTLVYTLGTSEAMSTENSMVRFHSYDPEASSAKADSAAVHDHTAYANPNVQQNTTTDIRINFNIDANPSAQVKIITDPRAGDNLTVFGNGTINATYHNKGAFEMFGTYRLTRGTYKLSIQDIIRKDLSIENGSSITFAGDPMQADLNLQALYTVNGVSLSDLNYSAGFNQKSVRVDCILNIGGKAKSPQISFDLDLHNISEDEKQMVRQLIATDEDMNRQIIYLLGIGRFYTANTSGSASQISSQQQSSAAMRSFLSTTITGQLNSAIANVLGSQSHWTFGTNVAPGTYGWNDVEVDGLLQGRLFNDRLLINGNFGYRDRPTYTSNFVGDFDIRYLLTPKGTVSLRAYSETTDRYFTKNSLTTQGIGLTLQRDFNRLRELFTPKRKRLKVVNGEHSQ